MEDLHRSFESRPRKQSLSAIIERIVMEKQRQKEKAVFDMEESRNIDTGVIDLVKTEESCGAPYDLRKMPNPFFKPEEAQMPFQPGFQPGFRPILPAPLQTGPQQTLSAPPPTFPAPPALGAPPAPTEPPPPPPPAHSAPPACPQPAGLPAGPVFQPTPQEEEDDMEDDEDSAEKEDTSVDPDRLKAFNMFVRMFVDENLDRMVPISRQPKERIQSIIDSCYRQFPEFGDRARKRLRTYLKACRRYKRGRTESASRQTMTAQQLISPQAQQILAGACQSEAAQQMLANSIQSEIWSARRQLQQPAPERAPLPAAACQLPPSPGGDGAPGGLQGRAAPPTPQERPAAPQEPAAALYQANMAHVLRQLLPGMTGSTPQLPAGLSPGELFFRRPPQPRLTPAEAAAVRQLANGYREAASFLRSSAEQLEALLPEN